MRSRRRRPNRVPAGLLGVLLALIVGVSACADDSRGAEVADPGIPGGSAPDPAPPTTTSLVIAGEPLNRYTLVVGDCFNTYVVGTESITTKVACTAPHRHEVFATHAHPARFGDPWPGEEALQKYAVRLCYQDFAAFAGIIYELSRLTIGAITPPQANWEDAKARYRGIQCFVTGSADDPLVGTMRGAAR